MSKKLGSVTAVSAIIASMVGTGIFTSLGIQLEILPSPSLILMMWLIGGLTALCGALTYADLVTSMPRSGGEYHYMKEFYGNRIGFLTGFVTIFAGFAAPIAACAYATGDYLLRGMGLELVGIGGLNAAQIIGLSSLFVMFLLLSRSQKTVATIQNLLVIVVLLLISGFVFVAFAKAPISVGQALAPPTMSELSSMMGQESFFPAMAGSFLMVFFSYLGWNAPVYIADEFKGRHKTLRRSLVIGTVLVTLLYLLINTAFLMAAPVEALAGKKEVGAIAAVGLFGKEVGSLVSYLVVLCLCGSTFCMLWTGTGVLSRMAEEHKALSFWSSESGSSRQQMAMLSLIFFATIFIATMSFSTIIMYIGYLLLLCATMCAFGLIRRLYQQGRLSLRRNFHTFVYFAVVSWVLVGAVMDNPQLMLACGGTLLLGTVVYELFLKEKEALEMIEGVE